MTHPIKLTISADLRYLHVIGALVKAAIERHDAIQAQDGLAYQLELAVHEICTNIIEHAYQYDATKQVRLQLFVSDTEFKVLLLDTGINFDTASVARPQIEALQERGLGLFLTNEIMDVVRYEHQNGTNHWTLIKYIGEN